MTMPKKGSRAVTVDGIEHRFMVSKSAKTNIEDGKPCTVKVLVEATKSPGHVLCAEFDNRRCPSVTPAVAEALVRIAREIIWFPEKYNQGTVTIGPPLIEEAFTRIGV